LFGDGDIKLITFHHIKFHIDFSSTWNACSNVTQLSWLMMNWGFVILCTTCPTWIHYAKSCPFQPMTLWLPYDYYCLWLVLWIKLG
jgi:hypothetical protein